MLTSITIRKVLALAVALVVLMTLAQQSGRLDPIWRVVTRSPAPAWSAGFTAPQDDELASGRWFGPPSCLISARANCDCQVDLGDLARVAGAWRCQAGDGCYDPYRDVNDDGSIDVADAAFALLRWREVCW